MDLMQSLIASKLLGGGGGSEPILKTKSIYENGTYSAIEDEADGYSSVTVDVPANVTSRELTVNGTFSSSVDNKDGYSNVTVNVQEAPVKTTSLSVTENGTYEPGPASEVSLTIPTIPDEIETEVSAGATITNFDNLRIEFTNKTTSATGYVDIYPSAIAVQQIPMSFKNRTLIMGPDGDHYITLVNGYDSIVVLQKGYTITAMKLTSYSGYFDEVTVDVPSDPDPSIYMYYWDLTKSLTDLIRGAQATLSTSGAEFIEGTGIVISSTGYINTAISHSSAINFWGKTIEFHIKNMSKNFGDTCRLLTYSNNVTGGLIFRTDHWQFRYGDTWVNYTQSSSNEILDDGVLKLVFDSDRNYVNVYINDTKIYEGVGWHTSKGTMTTDLPSVGSVNNKYYTSYNMTVTSIRVYENGSGGKGTTELNVTQNGTYTAPTGTAYSEVNVDVSQTPHLAARIIQNNSLFRSDVDGLDGYSNVVVNVADKTPHYEQLTVTQNGVYTPSSSSIETFGLADGILEEVETEVYAAGSVTRKDNLTIKCYDKVSQVGVTATINTSSIVNKTTPQSLREKTLIICEDADHYVYLTKTTNSLWVIQKGYTFDGHSFELEDNASAFNMVNVNLPNGTNIEY